MTVFFSFFSIDKALAHVAHVEVSPMINWQNVVMRTPIENRLAVQPVLTRLLARNRFYQ